MQSLSKNSLKKKMIEILGEERVLTQKLHLLCYSYDCSFQAREEEHLPSIVVLPKTTQEVSMILEVAYREGIPVTPRGGGTGASGGSIPLEGGILMDLSSWKEILEVDEENRQVFLRPGVIHSHLNQHLKRFGLFFPPDPGSSKMCTLGGMVANNSSGLRAVKYGSTGDYVLGLDVVLPNGEMITTGGVDSRALKSVSGLDLTSLFVGSEGILGVITKIRLKVLPRPPYLGLVMAVFQELEMAGEAVLQVFSSGLTPAAIEILDKTAITAVNNHHSSPNLPEAEAILLFELHGNREGVLEEIERVKREVEGVATMVEIATDEATRERLWAGRRVIGAATANLDEKKTRVFAGEDIAVPISQVPKALKKIRELAKRLHITVVIFGHIGDGNLHTAPIIDISIPEEVERVKELIHGIHLLAIELNGSTTGEHGVGSARLSYMEREHGPSLDLMMKIKELMDPEGIMNPGKLLPQKRSCNHDL